MNSWLCNKLTPMLRLYAFMVDISNYLMEMINYRPETGSNEAPWEEVESNTWTLAWYKCWLTIEFKPILKHSP